MGVPIDRGLTQWFLLYGIESHVEEVEMGVPIDRGLTHSISNNYYLN